MAGALHLLCACVNRAAFRSQADAVRKPVEQSKSKCLFETFHPAHDRRGTRSQGGCGLAKTQCAHDDDENPKVIPRNTLEQPGANELIHFCSRPLRILFHCPAHPHAMLLFGRPIFTGNRTECTYFRMRFMIWTPR